MWRVDTTVKAFQFAFRTERTSVPPDRFKAVQIEMSVYVSEIKSLGFHLDDRGL